MSTPGEPPIIIKKIVKGGHGHHGGSWKVAYADFVTAMMALFIVLWVIGQDKPVKQAIAMYFTDPSLTAEEISIKLAQGAEAVPVKPEEKKEDEPEDKKKERLKLLADKVKAALESAEWKQKLEGQIVIEMTDEGLRIELLDVPNAPFFQVSSAIPNQRTVVALKAIASQIRTVENPIVLEGHTDGRPFGNGPAGYGNWELSADRANAARRLLISGGVPEHRISAVRGFADTKLRVKSNPYDDRNRRISILLKLDGADELPTPKTSPAVKGNLTSAPSGAKTALRTARREPPAQSSLRGGDVLQGSAP